MAQVNFYKYNTTISLQENKSNIEEGSIVFDNEAKILYLVTKANTLEPYYGTDTKYSFSSSNNVLTITSSSGNSYNLTIDNVSHAGLADSATKAINDSEGNNISTTYLKNTGGIVSGTLNVDDLIVGNFLVKGSARFLNEIQGIIQYATKLGDDKSNLTVDNILSYLGSKVDRTTKVIAGNGLTGGGSLDSSITISHADTSDQSSVDGGTTQYIKSVALDDYGHVRGMRLADLPTNIASADLAQRARYADAIREPNQHRVTSLNQTPDDYALHYFLASSSCTEGRPTWDGGVLHAAWDNTSGYAGQLLIPTDPDSSLQFRWSVPSNGKITWSDWITTINEKNWASFIGTKTNPVNWANNATNATNAGKATTAENALTLNNFSQGFSNGLIPSYVEFPTYNKLVDLGYNTSENSTNNYYYFLGLLKWAYNKYKNNGDILLIGNATPNSTGNCQIQIYSNSPANDDGVPMYSSGLYESLTGGLYIFRTYDCNYYFKQIDADNANYATLAATATIANSIKTEEGTSNGDRPVFFSLLGDKTKIVYDNTFQYNPSTKNLTIANINGGAPITSVNIGNQRVAEAALADSAKSATTAGNSTLFNSYNFNDLKFNCINTRTITVEGDKDTFYPVGILVSSDKKWSQYISIHKDLGTRTPEITGNHSNGSSSMWAMYDTRNVGWDGNGGFFRTMYVSQPYAPLLARVEPNINGSNHMVVWLRGGGCVYNISSSYNLDDNIESISRTGILIKYEEFNFGFNETYPVIFGPIALADIDQYNKGIYTTGNGAVYSYYRAKSAESADTANTATSAGQLSSTRKIWGNDFNGTQNINGDIIYAGSISTSSMIRFLDNTSGSYGNGISIGGGGLTILGSGESASDIQGRFSSGNEDLIICSDEWIGMYPGQQDGYNDSKASYFHTNGAVSILCNTSSYALSVNGTTNFIGASTISSTLDVASNITSGNQIKGKTINIDSKCTIKYDDTDKCIKFVFA